MIKNILVVACSPPSDQEMHFFSAHIASKKTMKNHKVKLLSYGDLKELCKEKTHATGYDEICYVGHGSFHQVASMDMRARSIADRMIGSYQLVDVAQTSSLAIQKLKVHTFKFFTCESAVSDATYGRKDGVKVLREEFSQEQAHKIHELLETDSCSMVSVIEYVAKQVIARMLDTYDDRVIRIVGMNGVGYISCDEMHVRCFDLKHLHVFTEFRKKIGAAKLSKKKREYSELLKQERAVLQKYVYERPSAQKIELQVRLYSEKKT